MGRNERRLVALVAEIAALEAVDAPDALTLSNLNIKRGMLAQIEAMIAAGRA